MEKRGFLRNVGNIFAERFLCNFTDVLVVDKNFTFFDISKAKEQFCEGGFAGAGNTDKTDAFSGLNFE